MLGNDLQPIACKKLDNTAQGWPACLRAVSAAYELLQEADTLGQPITIYAPYQVLTLLEQKGGLGLTAGMRV